MTTGFPGRPAVSIGCDWVAFPENFSFFAPDKKGLHAGAETLTGVTTETLREWAIENDLWILGGSQPLRAKGTQKVTNTSLLISPDGEIEARYDKIHLFDAVISRDQAYMESSTVSPGKKVVTARMPFGGVGLSVCYDIRFPELYRKMLATPKADVHSLGFYCDNRKSALGFADSRACGGESVLCHRTRTVRISVRRATHPRAYANRGSVGTDFGRTPGWSRRSLDGS